MLAFVQAKNALDQTIDFQQWICFSKQLFCDAPKRPSRFCWGDVACGGSTDPERNSLRVFCWHGWTLESPLQHSAGERSWAPHQPEALQTWSQPAGRSGHRDVGET